VQVQCNTQAESNNDNADWETDSEPDSIPHTPQETQHNIVTLNQQIINNMENTSRVKFSSHINENKKSSNHLDDKVSHSDHSSLNKDRQLKSILKESNASNQSTGHNNTGNKIDKLAFLNKKNESDIEHHLQSNLEDCIK